jgi:uracil-DNA glycosylase
MTELESEKTVRLLTLLVREIVPKELDPVERWWTFPSQDPVRGFLGVRPLMVVGDQPSTSSWPESHPSRKLLYETLIELEVPDAHLTDVVKRRGKGSESSRKLPADFRVHIGLLRREIEIIQPSRIVALGSSAEQLLLEHLPEVREKVRRAWHFAYGARPGRAGGFKAKLRTAIFGP